MVSSIDSALSGLNAASTRLAVAASNIANQSSTKTVENGQVVDKPFTPQQVEQVSLPNGGVLVQVRDVNPPTTTVPDPLNINGTGTTEVPNVDQANELIQLKLASYDFKANLKSIKVQDDLFQSLLDIKT